MPLKLTIAFRIQSNEYLRKHVYLTGAEPEIRKYLMMIPIPKEHYHWSPKWEDDADDLYQLWPDEVYEESHPDGPMSDAEDLAHDFGMALCRRATPEVYLHWAHRNPNRFPLPLVRSAIRGENIALLDYFIRQTTFLTADQLEYAIREKGSSLIARYLVEEHGVTFNMRVPEDADEWYENELLCAIADGQFELARYMLSLTEIPPHEVAMPLIQRAEIDDKTTLRACHFHYAITEGDTTPLQQLQYYIINHACVDLAELCKSWGVELIYDIDIDALDYRYYTDPFLNGLSERNSDWLDRMKVILGEAEIKRMLKKYIQYIASVAYEMGEDSDFERTYHFLMKNEPWLIEAFVTPTDKIEEWKNVYARHYAPIDTILGFYHGFALIQHPPFLRHYLETSGGDLHGPIDFSAIILCLCTTNERERVRELYDKYPERVSTLAQGFIHQRIEKPYHTRILEGECFILHESIESLMDTYPLLSFSKAYDVLREETDAGFY